MSTASLFLSIVLSCVGYLKTRQKRLEKGLELANEQFDGGYEHQKDGQNFEDGNLDAAEQVFAAVGHRHDTPSRWLLRSFVSTAGTERLYINLKLRATFNFSQTIFRITINLKP